LVGYAAQVISPGTAYRSLEGPVIGTRVGIYESMNIDRGWKPVVANPPRQIPGGENAWTGVQGIETTSGCAVNTSVTSNSPRQIPGGESGVTNPYRLILYKLPTGAVEQSTTDNDDHITTLPRNVRKALEKRLTTEGPKHALLAPELESVPEDELLDIPDDPERPDPNEGLSEEQMAKRRRQSLDIIKNELPEERIEEDDNAEPSDDEPDAIPAGADNFKPTRAQITDLKLAHDNSGHPNNADFARMLKLGNAKPALVRWVRSISSVMNVKQTKDQRHEGRQLYPKLTDSIT